MNLAVMLAGGTGQRLGAQVPKQFVEVLGKPLIVHALEIYEKSEYIDGIEVVCVQGYIDTVWEYAEKWAISKLKRVVLGGGSCQESTRNGILGLEDICSPDDILMFVMSTSVFVDDDIIADSLRVCQMYGNAFAAMQCIYNLAETHSGIKSNKLRYKESHMTLNMPWTAPYGTFQKLYHRAYTDNIETGLSSYAPTLFLALGESIYLSLDTPKNKLHVTTQDDLEIIEACLALQCSRKEVER